MKQTQGRIIIAALKRKPHTYMDMLKMFVSVSPWKRVAECLSEGEAIKKGQDKAGRTTWRVVKA